MPDRDKVIKELEFCLNVGKCTVCEYSKGRMFTTCRHIIEDAEELLKEQSAIVRCKDCKYYKPGLLIECEKAHNTMQGFDWFCADGERRTDNA